jgi:hypothetical protein
MTERNRESSARLKARVAGIFYLLNILTGIAAMAFSGPQLASYRDAVTLAATVCYLVVTLLFYGIFKPVDGNLSLLAAFFSLIGCVVGSLGILHLPPAPVSSLVFFGLYCLLIGYLILRSAFLPRILGVLMVFAGFGWLTFLWPPLVKQLSPYIFAPGLLAEGSLTVWLLAVGLNEKRWMEQSFVRAAT